MVVAETLAAWGEQGLQAHLRRVQEAYARRAAVMVEAAQKVTVTAACATCTRLVPTRIPQYGGTAPPPQETTEQRSWAGPAACLTCWRPTRSAVYTPAQW